MSSSIPRGTAEQIWFSVAEQSKNEDLRQRPKPLTDFYGEGRHELVQKIAYQYWEKEALRWVRPKLIGLQPKRRCARAYWLQELSWGQTEIFTLSSVALNIEHKPFHNLED